MGSDSKIRLQKFIADCGVTSRRKAEELIVQGRVAVNGAIETTLGSKVNPDEDVVSVDGELVDLATISKVYLLMHKPRGYVTTLDDPEGRDTVLDLCPEVSERIYPVGRLDYLSEGLLILTNDGDVANMIMHPKHNIQKVYEVKVFGAVSMQILAKLKEGYVLEGRKIRPEAVRVIQQLENKTWLEFRLSEGKNREIRNICEAAGVTIDKLKRVAIANITVDGIAPGKYRFVTKNELLRGLEGGKLNKWNKEKKESYRSSKKTINISKKGAQPSTPADDPKAFVKFRKETYYTTLNEIKQRKEEISAKALAETTVVSNVKKITKRDGRRQF